MAPKEKAVALVQAFIDEGFLPAAARIAALIAVDEIINTGPLKMIDWGEIISDKPYWQEVKQEIEAL
jgi:hypothetical protein